MISYSFSKNICSNTKISRSLYFQYLTNKITRTVIISCTYLIYCSALKFNERTSCKETIKGNVAMPLESREHAVLYTYST